MPNPFGAPEIDVQRVEEKRQADEQFIWLDVREEDEIAQVAIVDERIVVVPLSALAARQLDALPAAVQDQQREIVVFCHHGVRSAQVAVWLAQQGWSNVVSMAGGIDAWARQIDSTVGFY